MVITKIPKNITFICRINKDSSIMDVFPVDSLSDKTNALKWVQYYKHKQFDFPNENFENLIITDLEERGNGGRAYKVILNNIFRFDLREDVLMDIIKYQGITKGGILKGPFKFVLSGSQMKLMFTDGDLFKQAVQRDKERSQTRISNDELVIGGIYESLNGAKSIYLGKGYKLQLKQISSHQFIVVSKITKSSKQMIWYKSHFSTNMSLDDVKEDFINTIKNKIGFGNNHLFKSSSSQSNIKFLGQINTSISSIRNNQFSGLLKFNKKITTNTNKFNDYDSGTHVFFTHVFAFLGAFLFFEENEPVKIPYNIFQKAESLFKHCMDLSLFKDWTSDA